MMCIRMKRLGRKITALLKGLLLIILILIILIIGKIFLTSIHTESNPIFTDGNLKIVMIDVGQGDSFLFLQNDKAMLIDCGTQRNPFNSSKALKEYNVRKLDYLIISHPHQDHAAGIFDILLNYHVDKLIIPDMSTCEMSFDDMSFYLLFKSYLNVANFLYGDSLIEYAVPTSRRKIMEFSDSIIEFIAPINSEYSKFNDYSLVMKISYGDIDTLMTGDIELKAENDIVESGANIQSEIYKAAHHGSYTSNNKKFLDEVNPSYVLISSHNGAGNEFGHPGNKFMKYLSKRGLPVFRTDERGTIEIETDGKSVFFQDEDIGDYKTGSELIEEESN